MADTVPTLRSLALSLGLSRATVSSALQGTGRVSPATKQRVLEAAQKAGYRHNPLAATLMSALRRSRGNTFRGVIAAVEVKSIETPPLLPFHQELVRGAQKRAAELGFKLEQFVVGPGELTLPRLETILESRSIHGLLLLPASETPGFSLLSWERYSGVYTDYNLLEPALHSVCGDHFSSMLSTLEELTARGYLRPGLFIERARNERLHRRHSAAFESYFSSNRGRAPVPPLITPTLSRTAFEQWFERFEPDVVLCHFTEALDWMEGMGARAPKTHGFVCLNQLNKKRPCAALDLQPREIGARGTELIVAQLHRNERGVPNSPMRTTILARWVEGPTVRGARVRRS
jgi:DNA-binding LacI/PurR family transcriptional regulator